jgi:hypothetical protein
MMAQEIDDDIMDPQPVWQGNPDRDFLIFRLIDLAESIATWFFTEADLSEYQRWRKAASRRKAKASLEPFECVRWKDAVHGILELHAQPRPGTFSLWCGSGLYETTVDFGFDENDYQISSAAVRSYAGDIKIGLDAVDGWRDTIIQIDAPYDGNDTELMLARLLDAANARPGGAESGLAPPTREDERRVQVLANAVAARFAKGKHSELYGDGKAYVESRPQCIWPILEGALAAFTTAPRNEHLISTYLYLLTHQLETIRYKLETGTPWAKPLLDTFQARITALAASPDMDPRDCAVLAKTIVDAKVDVDTSIGEALMNRAPPDAIEQGGDPAEALRPLLDQMAGSVSDSFELIEVLTETTSIMPPQMRAMIGFELGLSPHAVMRDAVPLLLIDPQTDVRQAAAAVLEKTAAPATLSPVALRRMILLRNWLPAPERDAVDRAIRKARAGGVTCAQWDATAPTIILGSTIDGAGTQSLIMTRTSGKSGLFAGLLLKLGFGVRDTWLDMARPDKETAGMIATVRRESAAFEVTRAYADLAVRHHLAVGLAEGNLPAAPMIAIAEAVGGADWQPQPIDISAELERLSAALGPAALTGNAIAASLKRSATWLAKPFGESWYEDNPDIRAIALGKGTSDQQTERVLKQVLGPRRPYWATLFLLLAARAQATIKPKDGVDFPDFLIMARELAGDRPLSDIPLMLGLAYRSLMIAQQSA